MQTKSVALFVSLLAFAANGAAQATHAHGRVVVATVHSAALEHNLLGDPADQKIGIYLPPSYAANPDRRYPVVYLLHGFGGSGTGWFEKPEPGSPASARVLQDVLDDANTDLIVVTPNGENRRGGSFYVNSAVNGNWEDFVARDVVAYVDAHYRTIAQRESRGIAGISMGGFGALRIGARHTETFGAIYAMSPCCTALVADLGERNPAWMPLLRAAEQHRALTDAEERVSYALVIWALASALSPDPQQPGLLADLPFRLENGTIVRNDAVFAEWVNQLPPAVVSGDLQHDSGVAIEYGLEDEIPHIPAGARATSDALVAKKVPHVLETFTGGHIDHLDERIRTRVIPFFTKTLHWQN